MGGHPVDHRRCRFKHMQQVAMLWTDETGGNGMIEERAHISERAETLRRVFDQGFVETQVFPDSTVLRPTGGLFA